MSPPLRTLFPFVCAAILMGGCKDKPEDGPSPDRTLEKLRLEVDRTNKGGAPAAPPDAPADPRAELADLAAAQESDTPKPLELASNKPVRVDTLELQPSGLESMHSLRGAGKVALTTSEDRKSTRLNSSHSGESRMPSSA